MPITGSQVAPTYARFGKMRIGATRVGYYQPIFKLRIASIERTDVRVADLTIRDYLDGQPNIATFRLSSAAARGQKVEIGLGGWDTPVLLFGGHIHTVTQIYEGVAANIAYDVTAVSYEWLLNRRKVIKRYTSQSATAIAQDLI